MNDLTLVRLPWQKAKASQGIFINLLRVIHEIKTNRSDEIAKARRLGKGDEYYGHVKEKSPHFIFGSIPGANKSISSIKSYTGLLFCDIDEEGVEESGFDVEGLKRAIFDQYPFVVYSSISFGGKGLGLVIHCPSLVQYKAPNAYEQAYKAFAKLLREDFNLTIGLDSYCFNPNRQTTLTYDGDILWREYPLSFHFDYKSNLPYSGKPEEEMDISLWRHEKLYTMFVERFTKFYASLHWVNSKTGMPVAFQENLEFDKEKYHLSRTFDHSIILKFDPLHRNKTETLVCTGEYFAATTIRTGASFKVSQGHRKSFLQSFVLNYCYLLKTAQKLGTVNKFYIYNLLLALNTMLYDKDRKKLSALSIKEINLLTSHIIQRIESDNFKPTVSKKTYFRTADFKLKVISTYKEGTNLGSMIVNEINKIKSKLSKINFDKCVEKYIRRKPEFTKEELVHYLQANLLKSDGKKYAKTTLQKKVNEKVSNLHLHTSISIGGGAKEAHECRNENSARIAKYLTQIMSKGEKVIKKDAYDYLTKFMSPATFHRHWLNVEEKVNTHNQEVE